jgi:tetratricopeptide (TPR) repeat protein
MKVLETANLTYHEWPKEEVALTRSSILSGIIAIGFEYGYSKRQQALAHTEEKLRLREAWRESNGIEQNFLRANAWHDMGVAELECENYDEAEQYLAKSLAIKHEWGTE